MNKTHKNNRNQLLNTMMVLLIICIHAAHATAQTETVNNNDMEGKPSTIIVELNKAVRDNDKIRMEHLKTKLKEHGDEAIKAINAEILQQEKMRLLFLQMLGGIPGDASTQSLLNTVLLEPENYGIGYLENRPINYSLNKNKLDVLAKRLNTDNIIQAGTVARLISNLKNNTPEEKAIPIIARYKQAIRTPFPEITVRHSYLPGAAYALNQFLLAFSNIQNPTTIGLLNQEKINAQDINSKKWFTIALGVAGEETVAQELMEIVNQDQDISSRILALRAYAGAAKQKAIPFLKSFHDDATVTGQDSKGQVYGLRIVVMNEIARLNVNSTDLQIEVIPKPSLGK